MEFLSKCWKSVMQGAAGTQRGSLSPAAVQNVVWNIWPARVHFYRCDKDVICKGKGLAVSTQGPQCQPVTPSGLAEWCTAQGHLRSHCYQARWHVIQSSSRRGEACGLSHELCLRNSYKSWKSSTILTNVRNVYGKGHKLSRSGETQTDFLHISHRVTRP